jgi:hypothetical protein
MHADQGRYIVSGSPPHGSWSTRGATRGPLVPCMNRSAGEARCRGDRSGSTPSASQVQGAPTTGVLSRAHPSTVAGTGRLARRCRRTLERVSRYSRYFAMMGLCLGLIISAWFVVRFYSTTAAVVMSMVALVIPPFAAIVGNRRS